MSEWWTYSLASFLLFSPRTYYRLFELYNAAIWPLQIVAVGLGAAIPVLSRRNRGRLVAAILAAGWYWIAADFLAHRYATINWAASYFAWAFAIEGVLLIWLGIFRNGLVFARPTDLAGRMGLGMFLFALFVEPLAAPLLGRGWRGVELFGVAPDPTAVATLGILLLSRGRGRGALMIVPVLWCAVTGAFLLAMKAPDAWVAPLAAVVAVACAARQVRDPSLRSG
jgi:hypothetical protein